MKRKGNINVITDRDIIVTGNTNAGNNLNTVIEDISDDLIDIKSQLKWTHKYGAVGSGSGGGGSTTKWAIIATLDGQNINSGNTISLNRGAGNYALKIAISGGSSEYSVTYTYGTISRSVTLNSENKWRLDTTIPLSSNGTISIEVTDNIQIRTAYASYITNPYNFEDLILVMDIEHDLKQYPSENIYIDDAKEKGLYVKCKYEISVNAEVKYSWNFLNQSTEELTIEDKNGYILFHIPDEIIEDEFANAYNVILNLKITPENQNTVNISKTITFNLIPGRIYLQITPQVGLVYDEEISEENVYKYSINREIAFDCRAYLGVSQNRDCTIEYWKDSDEINKITFYGKEGETYTFKAMYDTPGWHKISFRYNIGTAIGTSVKWLYCQQASSSYNWFKPSVTPDLQSYYRGYEQNKTSNIVETITNPFIQAYSSNIENITYNFAEVPQNLTNVLINIGIQYNSINNTSNPIAIIRSNETSATNEFITIYQNKIDFDGVFASTQSCNFFLHKEEDYIPGEPDKYHLISIAIAPVYYDESKQLIYYEYNVFVDGVFEGAINNWPTAVKILGSIEFLPGNYSINHFSVDYFIGTERGVSLVHDSDINYFHNTYLVKSRNDASAISDEDTAILNFLYDSSTNKTNYYMKNNLVHVENTLYDNVAKNTNVPTMVLCVDEVQTSIEGSPTIYQWMNSSYEENSSDPLANAKISVKSIKWGKNKNVTAKINIPETFLNWEFYIKLQGSSTMSNKSKNFTLGLRNRDLTPDSTILIFSPNYKNDDSKSFLHESEFNLKADVVDSAHSNNVAIGRFVNDYNNFTYTREKTGSTQIESHVRKCLDGFPILLYMEVKNGNNTDTYYLGVYSFNLGRESYFNLGYADLSQLDEDRLADSTDTSFSFTTVGAGSTRGLDPVVGFVAAEVQNNSKYWDFSQWDSSILFKQQDETANYMFGDIVTYGGNSGANTTIQNFVKSVSRGGGYIFEQIGKSLEPVYGTGDSDNSILYQKVNTVPDYKTQYTRNNTVYTEKPEKETAASFADLFSCIGGYDDGSLIPGYLNYNSAAYYYTTCMAFGLIDSVQKNTNIKTWNNKEFGLFFYDMDTCLGRDNDGNASSYFCFSDYWKSNIVEYDSEGNVIDRTINPTAVAARTVNNGITINRDYFPPGTSITGYDIPSSYLFAIAKYTKALDAYKGAGATYFKAPQTIYGDWRTVGGPLETASAFINRYYASNLAEIPNCLLNLNYRNKYLYYRDGDEDRKAFSDVSKYLFGRGIEVTTEWLNGRLHILDAYFNLVNDTITISGDYIEPKTESINLQNNNDILVLRDIFQKSDRVWSRKASTLKFKVSAPSYTPLMIKGANSWSRYLLEKEDLPYEISTSFTGVQTSTFGGSQLWKTLDYINDFVDSSSSNDNLQMYMNNKYLENIVGTSGTYTGGFEFILPAVKTITLNSPGYGGSLTIDSSFENLSSIDISRSAISLNIDGALVSTINASNVNSSTLSIRNCNYLTNVNLSGASVNTCTINPAWTKDLNISNNRIKSLSVTGKPINGEYGTLTIANNSTITDVTFADYKKVLISGCSGIQNITCQDNVSSRLQELYINNCTNLNSLTVYLDGLTTLNLEGCTNLSNLTLRGTDFSKLTKLNLYRTKVKYITFDTGTDNTCLDLSRFTNLGISSNINLTYINLGSNSEVEEIQFANNEDPIYLTYNLQNCTKLKRVYGNISVNVTSCFQGLRNFSIHGSNLTEVTWHGQNVLSNDVVRHPKDITNNYRSTGNKVTNLTFGISDSGSAFYQTNCTLFDYYYMLSNLGSGTSLSNMFSFPQNTDYGFFDIETGNNPDLRLFQNCGNVTSVNFCFGYGSNHKIYLTSPTVLNGIVTEDNGLFSPLINCTDFSGVFYSYTYLLDKYIFRRAAGNYRATSLNYFNPSYVLNEPPANFNWGTIINIYSDLKNNTGDISGFFDNLPSLTSIGGFLSGVNYIDYSKGFAIPAGVTTIASAFVSAKAYSNNFTLSDFFVNPANVQYIRQSFRMTGTPTSEYYVNMPLTNDTFSLFTNVVEIGYGGSGSWGSTDYFVSSFTGFNKIIDNEFPINIFANNRKATRLSGIFMNATSNVTYSNLELPGEMFANNTELEDVSALFYNAAISYSLSANGTNFKNCRNLKNLDYTFAEAPTNNKLPSLSGSVPYKFLWHGETETTKTYYGTDTREPIYDDNHEIIGYNYIDVQPYTVTTKTVKSTITSMKYCFQHSNLFAYSNNNIDSNVEDNPNYAPYRYFSESADGPFTVNPNIDKRQYTFIWVFDGYHFPSDFLPFTKNNYEILDTTSSNSAAELNTDCTYENIIVNTGGGIGTAGEPSNTYVAPPDLLRYCSNSCEIDGLFAYSGIQGWNYQWNGAGGYNQYGYGLKGRICPYMLKPVYNITSVKDMFRCCKLLSYYRHDAANRGSAYMIPEDFFTYAPRVTNLTSMFEDTMQPQLSELTTVFAPLTNTLNITRLFYSSYWDGSKYANTYTELENSFKNHEVSSTEKAFCITTATIGTDRVRNQYIKFSNMFDSKYSSNSYSSNMNYSDTFRGYTKLGDDVDNERFGVKTLVDNNITNNYTL